MIRDLIGGLGIEPRLQEGVNFVCDCPFCGGDKLYIHSGNGSFHCFHCEAVGHPYQLVQKLNVNWQPREIFGFLAKFSLAEQKKTHQDAPGSKKLMLSDTDVHTISLLDTLTFCHAKSLDRNRFLELRPMRHRRAPWVLIPAFSPDDMQRPVGWVRAGVDGSLVEIKTTDGPRLEKYPLVKGSSPGLIGLHGLVTKKPGEPVILVEGFKAQNAVASLGYCCVCKSHGVKSWDKAWLKAFAGQDVIIMFDRDSAGNGGPKTVHGKVIDCKQTDTEQAKEIRTVAKSVKVVRLPVEYRESNGLDPWDWIVTDKHTREDLKALIDETPEFMPEPEPLDLPAESLVLADDQPDTIALEYEKQSPYKHKYHPTDGWSMYKNDRYQEIDPDKQLARYVSSFIGKCVVHKGKRLERIRLGARTINDVIRQVGFLNDVYLLPSQAAPCSFDGTLDQQNIIALRNCLLDAETGKTYPLNDQFYTFNYLPYDYIEDAVSDKWGQFLYDIMDGDAELMLLLQQWSGYLLMRGCKFQKFLLCVGEGANGKFVFFDTIAAALGKQNVSNVPLASFINPFKVFGTFGKMVNMSNENAKHLEENAESVLKEYVGGDKMMWERKYKDAVFAYPTAKLMFATNILPIIRDSTDGIWRRMIYVPFDVQIPEGKQNRNLAVEMQDPKELAGVLNWMLEGRASLVENNGFIEAKKSKEKLNKYRLESNSARLFISEYVEVSTYKDDYVIKANLYAEYQKWCKENGYQPKGNSQFGQEMFRVFSSDIECQKRLDGSRKWVYMGIKLQEGIELSRDCHGTVTGYPRDSYS